MFYNSGKPYHGAHGRNPASGSAAFGELSMMDKLRDVYQKWGMTEAQYNAIRDAPNNDDRARDLAKFTGITYKPTDGEGKEMTGKAPIEWGGKTYLVDSKTGLKVINEAVLDDIATQAMDREDYVSDVVDLLLYGGDTAVMAIDHELYKDLKGGVTGFVGGGTDNVLPSAIKNTVDKDAFGDKIRQLKARVDRHIDHIVFPEKVLEKLRNRRQRHNGNTTVDMKHISSGAPTGPAAP